jgi:glucosamine--fructose-6-phosphate aminotransferase (isomerizing)
MCGIVAYKGDHGCLPFLFDGLQRLEYRGYDSVGISYLIKNNLITNKQPGCVADLKKTIKNLSINSYIGIGHTRWATHGGPCYRNSHPHVTKDNRLSIVHNGIIENYLTLKKELVEKQYDLVSDTDTEVLLYLVYDYLVKENISLFEAVKLASERIEGAFSIVVMDSHDSSSLVCCKRGSPLVIGIRDQNYYVASDRMALKDYADEEAVVEDNSVCKISDDIYCYNLNEKRVSYCNMQKLHYQYFNIEKESYEHFMLKEIYEQPNCISNCLAGRIDGYRIKLGGLIGYESKFSTANNLIIVACGSSWHAALLGKYYIEEFCKIKVNVEYASEFAGRNPHINKNDIVIGISQSGETADTILALSVAKKAGALIVGLCNSPDSSMVRLTDCGIFLRAGMEIGVASTKAFTNQILCLLLLSLWIQQNQEKDINIDYRKAIMQELGVLDKKIIKTLKIDRKIKSLAKKFKKAKNCLYLGREYNFPVALEGALKLKEISYVHAEGYPAAEMKHGPIALIDKNMPVLMLNNNKKQKYKIENSIKEIQARNGKVITISDNNENIGDFNISVPTTMDCISPFISVIPLQLFSYYSALERNCNVDKPRNLAKSVTVE